MNKDLKHFLQDFTLKAIEEDVRGGDHTTLSTIPRDAEDEAYFLVKEVGVIAGLQVSAEMFRIIDPNIDVTILIKDGQEVLPGDIVMRIKGSVHNILKAERLVLNVMQRMSGIATKTRQYVEQVSGTNTRIMDTRKTTPLLRILEKEAVSIGGGVNHRFGLYDMILIKDNHIDYAGGIAKALDQTYRYLTNQKLDIKVEIEVRDFEELEQVLAFGRVDRIMLDNFTPEDISKALNRIGGQYKTEASGGITLSTVRAYAETGVDYISVGDLTHSINSLDISLKASR